jgi:hypothetical protein
MDIATLVTTAISLVGPFIVKSGEAVAEKVGEDIWNVIKKPFSKKGREITTEQFRNNPEEIKADLIQELQANSDFRADLEKSVQQAQTKLKGNFQQNINSYDEVQKQINIQNNTGNITM